MEIAAAIHWAHRRCCDVESTSFDVDSTSHQRRVPGGIKSRKYDAKYSNSDLFFTRFPLLVMFIRVAWGWKKSCTVTYWALNRNNTILTDRTLKSRENVPLCWLIDWIAHGHDWKYSLPIVKVKSKGSRFYSDIKSEDLSADFSFYPLVTVPVHSCVISTPRRACINLSYTLPSVKHVRVKCLVQGHSIRTMSQYWDWRNIIFLRKSCTKRGSKLHDGKWRWQTSTL